jgi:hypothetical protein
MTLSHLEVPFISVFIFVVQNALAMSEFFFTTSAIYVGTIVTLDLFFLINSGFGVLGHATCSLVVDWQ